MELERFAEEWAKIPDVSEACLKLPQVTRGCYQQERILLTIKSKG